MDNYHAAMESVEAIILCSFDNFKLYRMHIVPKQNISFDEQASAIAIRKWIVVQLFLLQWRILKITRAVLLNVDDVTI